MALMELLPEKIAKKLKTQWQKTGTAPDAEIFIYLKIFDPCGAATWYITEQNPENPPELFGLACIQDQEMGYIDLRELQQYEGPLGIGLERDLWWTPISFQELKRQLAARKLP